MMTGTDLPADHVVAKLIPRLGKATIEKIAINAVMAGALPTHMPVLIAAVQTLMDPRSRFDTFEVSTGSWAPFFVVNGPIRNDIHINCSSGALSPGDIANAAIGRAMGLIVKNIGGARKGVEDMGVFGNPGKYSLVLGEYEEESPWEPLHVERGFQKRRQRGDHVSAKHLHTNHPARYEREGFRRNICEPESGKHVLPVGGSIARQSAGQRRMDEEENQGVYIRKFDFTISSRSGRPGHTDTADEAQRRRSHDCGCRRTRRLDRTAAERRGVGKQFCDQENRPAP